jgi:stress-induced-phosphoprotein 1
VLTKLKNAEKLQKEAEAKAYENPELSDKARDEGNKLFKGGDYAGSVKLYSEAIKRNPKDARGYTNRAAAYTKLLALAEALKDAEKAIEV